MIRGKADLEAAKRAYAAAGFVYKGRKPVLGSPGMFKHVWEKPNCAPRKRTSRRSK